MFNFFVISLFNQFEKLFWSRRFIRTSWYYLKMMYFFRLYAHVSYKFYGFPNLTFNIFLPNLLVFVINYLKILPFLNLFSYLKVFKYILAWYKFTLMMNIRFPFFYIIHIFKRIYCINIAFYIYNLLLFNLLCVFFSRIMLDKIFLFFGLFLIS